MPKTRLATTYIVEIRTSHRYGLSEDRYFRTIEKAKQEVYELEQWFGENSSQTFKIVSHQIVLS